MTGQWTVKVNVQYATRAQSIAVKGTQNMGTYSHNLVVNTHFPISDVTGNTAPNHKIQFNLTIFLFFKIFLFQMKSV